MTATILNLMPEGELDPVRIARALRDELKGEFTCYYEVDHTPGRSPLRWEYHGRDGWAGDGGALRLNRAISERFIFWHKQGNLTQAQVAQLERAKGQIIKALADRSGMGPETTYG